MVTNNTSYFEHLVKAERAFWTDVGNAVATALGERVVMARVLTEKHPFLSVAVTGQGKELYLSVQFEVGYAFMSISATDTEGFNTEEHRYWDLNNLDEVTPEFFVRWIVRIVGRWDETLKADHQKDAL